MPQTLKGIKHALGRFADKFRRRTKKPSNVPMSQRMTHNNAVALQKHHRLAHREYQKLIEEETDELKKQNEGCARDLSVLATQNAKQHLEINELKHTIQNYERIAADSNKLNRDLQDELVKCQGSKSRKQGSSKRLQNSSSSVRQQTGLTSTGYQSTGLTSTGPTSSSVRRSVKIGSRRPSKLIRSRKPELNIIPELNEPTENSSKRRARLAKQNEMKQTALNFISAHMKAYTQKRKAINNAKAAEKAAANQAAANAKKRANNALRNKKLAHIGMMRRGG